MANNSSSQGKVEVNGDAPALNPTMQNQITMGLAQNGGLKRIEAKLREGLDEAGWSQAVKEYATQLLRSGEATTFPEMEEKIRRQIFAQSNGNTTDDSSGGVPLPNLAVPRDAVERGAAQVKKELAGVVEMKKSTKTGDSGDQFSDVTEMDAPGSDITSEDAARSYITEKEAPSGAVIETHVPSEVAKATQEDVFKVIQAEARESPGKRKELRPRVNTPVKPKH